MLFESTFIEPVKIIMPSTKPQTLDTTASDPHERIEIKSYAIALPWNPR